MQSDEREIRKEWREREETIIKQGGGRVSAPIDRHRCVKPENQYWIDAINIK